ERAGAGPGSQRRQRLQRRESAAASLWPGLDGRRRSRGNQMAIRPASDRGPAGDRSAAQNQGSSMTSGSATLPSTATVPPRVAVSLGTRLVPPIFITCILIGAHLSFGVLESYTRTGLAIVTAIAAELVMARVTYGRWPDPASAYITGLSVGI